ncbi:MAG: GTP-binding protein [Candidatus Aenigmarchaeota archaeon]|nr:GTP-binding protein [Candidatus Aenigmarchaeota archaeon]
MEHDNEKLDKLKEELAKTPSNKATQGHLGLLKAKIANIEDTITQKKKGTGSSWGGYSVKKSGDGTVVLVGYPSVGKSTLLNYLTNAESEVAAYDFTTLDVIPGMLAHRDVNLQILDVPGLVTGAASGKGRGKEVLAVARIADLLLIIVDAKKDTNQFKNMKKELYDSGIRMNVSKPNVKIIKKDRGGIMINSSVRLTKITRDTIRSVLKGYRISNADLIIHDNIDDNELIDVIRANRIYVKMFVVLNKIDAISETQKETLLRDFRKEDVISISARNEENLDMLKDKIIDKIGYLRIYTKPLGKEADMSDPLIMRKGNTIHDVCKKLNRSFNKDFKFAKIWGKSAKFPGQQKNLDHRIMDKDIIELHT